MVWMIVGGLCLAGVSYILLMPGPVRRSINRKGAEAPIAASVKRTVENDPGGFPPEHATNCDFKDYHRVMVSQWLPAGVVRHVDPTYPESAREARIAGRVNVSVLINRQGQLERVCSVGPMELRVAAETAAVQWRFRRPTVNAGTDPLPLIEQGLVFNFVIDERTPAHQGH